MIIIWGYYIVDLFKMFHFIYSGVADMYVVMHPLGMIWSIFDPEMNLLFSNCNSVKFVHMMI